MATEKAIAFENQFDPRAKKDPNLRATNISRIGKAIIDQEMGKKAVIARRKSIADFSPRKSKYRLHRRASLPPISETPKLL